MLRVVRALICLLAVSSIGTAFAQPKPETAPPPAVKTVIVVRHAEADGPTHGGGDPVLSADGRARALELSRTLADAPLRTVYSTHYKRNRQTAEPLPRKAGENP